MNSNLTLFCLCLGKVAKRKFITILRARQHWKRHTWSSISNCLIGEYQRQYPRVQRQTALPTVVGMHWIAWATSQFQDTIKLLNGQPICQFQTTMGACLKVDCLLCQNIICFAVLAHIHQSAEPCGAASWKWRFYCGLSQLQMLVLVISIN